MDPPPFNQWPHTGVSSSALPHAHSAPGSISPAARTCLSLVYHPGTPVDHLNYFLFPLASFFPFKGNLKTQSLSLLCLKPLSWFFPLYIKCKDLRVLYKAFATYFFQRYLMPPSWKFTKLYSPSVSPNSQPGFALRLLLKLCFLLWFNFSAPMLSFSRRAVRDCLYQRSGPIFSLQVSPFNAPFQTLTNPTAMTYFISMLHACTCTHVRVLSGSPNCKPIRGQREQW